MKQPGLLLHHLYWGLGLGAAVVMTIQILTWVGLGLSNLSWILPWVLVVVFAVQIDAKIAAFRRQWETGFVFTLGLVAYALPEIVLGLLAMVLGVVQPWKKSLS